MEPAEPFPFWITFLLGPLLLAFAVWVVPGRLGEARRSTSARPGDVFDAWFPALWACGVGAFGVLFILSGLLRLLSM